MFLDDDHFRTILMVSVLFWAGKSSWGLENEALIVRCPRQGRSRYPVDWYYSKTNKCITTQKRNHVLASGERLKFLPAKVNDSGIYTCIIRRYQAATHNLWACSLFFDS